MPFAADLYYFEHQGGTAWLPPVILIHGAGGHHLHWPAQIRRLGKYPIYAVDLPGHGKSSGRGQQTIAAYAQNLISWMDALDMHRAVFVGHSMGGAIALWMGTQRPERVLGLGLVATGAKLKVDPAILENASRSETFPTLIEMIANWAFGPQADERLVELATQRMAEIRPSVMHSDFVACRAFNIMTEISGIPATCAVICGEDDQLTPHRHSQYLAANIPKATLHLIPNAGHMVQLEQPEAVAEALTGLLKNIPFQPGGEAVQ